MDAQEKLARLQKFLSFDPDNQALWVDAVRLAVEVQEWETAKKLVDEVSQTLLGYADVNALAGQVLLVHKQYDEAAAYLEQAIALNVSQPATWINLAYCHFYRKQFLKALEVLNSNLLLPTEFPSDFYMLSARLAHHLDDSELAIQHLKEMHENYSITAESAGLLSLLLFEADREEELAMQMANLALEKNPHAIEALIARTSLRLDAGAYDLAQADVQLAIEHHPYSGRAWASLAQIEFNNLHFDQAREAAETALQHMPDHIGTWHLLGWTHLMQSNYEKSLDAFQRSYDLDRRFAETHGGLASVYAHMGETKLANNHIKLAVKLDPENFSATYAKMVLLNNNNEGDKAQALFNTAVNTVNTKIKKTPQELINKRMKELMQSHKGDVPGGPHKKAPPLILG